MRKIWIAFVFTCLFCVSLLAQEQNSITSAVWISGAFGEQPASTIVKSLSDNYIQEVYLLVKGGAGRMVDSTRLTEFITTAHAQNIKVCFWYIVGDDNKFLSSHPDAHLYHCPKPSIGFVSPYPDSGSNVNFLYPGFKEYVLDQVNYLLANFDCDGIHLDVIRYTNLTFSFDKYSLQKGKSLGIDTKRLLDFFVQDYDYYVPKGGVKKGGFVDLYINGDKDVVGWVNMRKNIIYDYIKSIKDVIQKVKPEVPLTAAFMPEATLTPDIADVYYAQSYSLNSPLLDMIAPMAYFKAFDEPTSWLKSITEGALKQVGSECKIFAGVQSYDGTTPEELKEEILYALEGGASGIVIFRYATTTPEQWDAVKEIFKEGK